jgi:DNA-binding GntR family transcriptional regulator
MTPKERKPQRSGNSVNRIHDQLKTMVVTYQLRPSERVNEVELAESLGVSRTPLREALNRLVAEGLLTFLPNYGFAARSLDTKTIYELYQLRSALEALSVKLAVVQASDAEIDALTEFWEKVSLDFTDYPAKKALEYDLEFHARLAALSGNTELSSMLDNISARLYFVRLVFMGKEHRRLDTCEEHQTILAALKQRNADTCVELMQLHINRLQKQLVEVIRESITLIYTRELHEG